MFVPFEPHGRGGPRIREIPIRMVLPNLITVLAICAGLSGIRLRRREHGLACRLPRRERQREHGNESD